VTILAEARNASMTFGGFSAVDDVDLTIENGEIVGLLGANGAGKTTLIRLLLGLLNPSRGTVQLFGATPTVSTRRRLGYVPQTLGLYVDLTVEENWEFSTAAFQISQTELPERIAPWDAELVGTLPLGAQRQVAFAIALSHQPELLVLDEPTSGVGPLASARLWQEVRQAAEVGVGVLVTTHNMEEAEQCDRLVVMADGRVSVRGTAEEIVGDRTVAEVKSVDWRQAFSALEDAGFAVTAYGASLRVVGTAAAVSELLTRRGISATVKAVPANLEEAFVAIVTEISPQ
jgi:ABC-2 type transport system ATP-binding protein/ribosome-dependent ATPase